MPISIQRTLAAALGAVLLLPVARATSSPRMERKQRTEETRIREARAASNAAIRAHDAERVASSWTEDYSLVASTNLAVTGREANRASFASHFEERPDVVYVRTPREIGLYEPWGMAYEWGDWEGSWTEEEGELRIGGTYLAKWQRVSDRWLIRAEIFVPTHCEGTSYCGERR
ncbi:MAG TPA: nuclear transport factor 2 family protein [Vicinamibacteria bacterium]|nr:nuclear transport factor 2 family protein [Vicinamibacteria bacterium]